MSIEPVSPSDLNVWKALRHDLYTGLDEGFHDAELAWFLASDEAAAFLARSDAGEAIGLLELSLRNIVDGCIGGPVGYIEGLYVAPPHRGIGLGRQLAAFATDWCAAHGCRDIATDTELENAAAQAFFRRLGFAEGWRTVGFRKSLGER